MEANVYYNPEEFGLEVVAEVEYSSGYYEFDTRIVWKDKNNILWTARDAGCSCPTPFEDYSLETIERVDFPALESEVQVQYQDRYNPLLQSDGMDFLNRVKEAVK